MQETGQTRPSNAVKLAWRIWKQLSRRQHLFLILASVAMLGAAFLTSYIPVVVGELVNRIVGDAAEVRSAMITGLIIVATILLSTQLLQVVRRQLVESVATSYERDIRSRAYKHILHSDLSYIKQGKVGGIYGRINRGIEGTTKLLKLSFMDFFPTGTLAFAALVVAFSRDVYVALVMACVVPTGLLLVRWQIKSQAGIRVKVRNHKEEIDGQVVELLPALETVRAYDAQDYFSDRVANAATDLRSTEMRHHRAMAWFDAGKYTNEAVWYVLVLSFTIILVIRGELGPGEVLTYALLFNSILAPLRELHRMLDEAAESGQQARDLADVLGQPLDASFSTAILQQREVAGLTMQSTTTPADRAVIENEQIVVGVKDLSFNYLGTDDVPVLKGITLSIRAGERIGLAGPSGCGKSTLLKLLDRLQHGYTGDIHLFGTPLTSFNRKELARRVGYVSQRYFLYRGTVYDNIVFGLNRSANMAEVVEAARRAHIHDVIMSFPKGYDTLIQERGDSISGGQAQRICIARALLRRPDLLLLDEPTSALDNESQRVVQKAIDELSGITIIEVAHRLDTLRSADRIYVLEAGQIAEQGTHDELAVAGGVFTRLLQHDHDESPLSSA